jgi:hypothetical protein
MSERRSEIRMLCADMVEVHWSQRGARKQRATALLEDISSSGACLQFETPMPLGTQVRLNCSGEHFTGAVRYCIYREIGYFVGVQFTAGSKWTRKQFEPQHLLDLERLVMRCARRAARRGAAG